MAEEAHRRASGSSRVYRTAARLALTLALWLGFAAIGESESMAIEIAILKSSSIGAYDQAIEGFKTLQKEYAGLQSRYSELWDRDLPALNKQLEAAKLPVVDAIEQTRRGVLHW